MKKSSTIKLKISKGDPKVGYIYLPIEPSQDQQHARTIALSDLIENYQGIPVYLDFNKDNELLGIEIVG